MSDDTPTQRFDAPLTPSSGIIPPIEPDGEKKKSRGLLIALIAVGAILVIAIIVVLLLLLRGNGTPTAAVTPAPSASASLSPTPTSTPSPTVSASASPTPTKSSSSGSGSGGGTAAGPSIASFTANPTTVACPASDATVKNPTLVDFRWSTSNVDSVEFGLIASDGSYQTQVGNLSPQGTDNSDIPGSPDGWAYSCGTHSITYVLKVTGGGQTKTAKVTVTDVTY